MKRSEKILALAWTALPLYAALEALGLVKPSLLAAAPLCPFHFLTGHDCPGCGMTRACVALFQGRWSDAWGHHPLALPLIGAWTAWLAWGLRNRAKGRPFSAGWPDLLAGARGWAALAVVLGVWLTR